MYTYLTHALLLDPFADWYFTLDTVQSSGPTGGWSWLLAPMVTFVQLISRK